MARTTKNTEPDAPPVEEPKPRAPRRSRLERLREELAEAEEAARQKAIKDIDDINAQIFKNQEKCAALRDENVMLQARRIDIVSSMPLQTDGVGDRNLRDERLAGPINTVLDEDERDAEEQEDERDAEEQEAETNAEAEAETNAGVLADMEAEADKNAGQ